MDPVPGPQLKEICGALVGAFTENALAQVLRFELNRTLEEVVTPGKWPDRVFELVNSAEKGGWLRDLLRAARASNPGNRALRCEAITRLIGPDPADPTTFHSSTPNNLPRLQPFFGREKELAEIRAALTPEARTWGASIDGPGGMGKTSLAVCAAYDCPLGLFQRIIFVSLKNRELDDDGVRVRDNLLVPGFLELLNKIARELGQADIAKSPEDQRIELVRDALRPTRALLILDNLESLPKSDRDQLVTFVYELPQGSKAILTSRRRIGSGADTLILQQLDQGAALATLAELARRNRLLARTTEAERIELYTKTGGTPLLLRWVAGQLGRGSCRTLADALDFLSTCPVGNDPLEFVFGDLATEFTPEEERVLVALTYFAFPAKVEHVATVAGLDEQLVGTALFALSNRSLVVPNQEETEYALVPLVAEFLRKHRTAIVRKTGERLEGRAYALVVENGYQKYDRFAVLDAVWPTVAPALPLFLAGPNPRLQTVCYALVTFLDFTGRWDESLSLNQQAEARFAAAGEHFDAGWRAHDAGYIHYLREQADAVLICADRVAAHWLAANAGPRESAAAIVLRGLGHRLKKDYPAAIAAYRDAIQLWRSLSTESDDVATGLNALADAEHRSGDFAAAEQDYSEALRVARSIGSAECVAICTGNLAELALDREDWSAAEGLARESLTLSEKMGRKELIAHDSLVLAKALGHQGKTTEARPHALCAVDLFTELRSPQLAEAETVLREREAFGWPAGQPKASRKKPVPKKPKGPVAKKPKGKKK